jgi:hypothetical protein
LWLSGFNLGEGRFNNMHFKYLKTKDIMSAVWYVIGAVRNPAERRAAMRDRKLRWSETILLCLRRRVRGTADTWEYNAGSDYKLKSCNVQSDTITLSMVGTNTDNIIEELM